MSELSFTCWSRFFSESNLSNLAIVVFNAIVPVVLQIFTTTTDVKDIMKQELVLDQVSLVVGVECITQKLIH